MSERSRDHEWDAATYHVISNPQLAWGLRVLERLSLLLAKRGHYHRLMQAELS